MEALAHLAASLDRPDFAARVLETVTLACRLRNFAVFLIPDARRPVPILTLFHGNLGSYQLRRNASEATRQESYPARIAALIAGNETSAAGFERSVPASDDPRRTIYERSKLSERIASVHREGGIAYVINYYRSAKDGAITEAEERRLRQLLPIVNALIVARHKIFGADAFQRLPRFEQVISLRQGGAPLFRDLSVREAQVCDRLSTGLSLRGVALELDVSENTAKTLRARAYRKLGIVSISQLFALLTRGGVAQASTGSGKNRLRKI